MNKIYDSGMVVGRFQTFHLGHQHLIDSALQLCDRVLVFVGSSQEYGTERNPLNVETRIRMLRQIYENDKEVMIYPLPDLTEEKDITPEWGKYVLDNCKRYLYKNPEIFVFGNDTNRGSSRFTDEDLNNTSQFIINRATIPISGTKLRELMVYGDIKRSEWMSWVNPKLHKFYDEIRGELMTVPFYQEMQIRLLSGLAK